MARQFKRFAGMVLPGRYGPMQPSTSNPLVLAPIDMYRYPIGKRHGRQQSRPSPGHLGDRLRYTDAPTATDQEHVQLALPERGAGRTLRRGIPWAVAYPYRAVRSQLRVPDAQSLAADGQEPRCHVKKAPIESPKLSRYEPSALKSIRAFKVCACRKHRLVSRRASMAHHSQGLHTTDRIDPRDQQ